MPIFARKAGVLREISSVYYRKNGVLRTATDVWRRENGVLRDVSPASELQVIDLAASWFSATSESVSWFATGTRPKINNYLSGGNSRYFSGVTFAQTDRRITLQFSDASTGAGSGPSGQDLITAFEQDGSIKIESAGVLTRTFNLNGSDTSEPYVWTPNNPNIVFEFVRALKDEDDGSVSATLTIASFEQ